MNEDLKCQICGAPATVHITQIVGGKTRKIHFCEKCATTHNATELPLIKFAEMITKQLLGEKLGNEILKGKIQPVPEEKLKRGKKCPNCGLSESELEKKERLGCEKCYEIFAEELNVLLPKIQHVNPPPTSNTPEASKKRAPKKSPAKPSLEDLERLLQRAVKKEDYRLAAQTRDQIAALKQKTKRRKNSLKTDSGSKAGTPTTKKTTRKRKNDE